MEKIKKTIAQILNKITSITHVFGILAIAVGALLIIYDARYLLSFGGGWDYINNIIVEAHGLFFDLLVLGVLISIYERRRQKKEAIERDQSLINDFRGWDQKEAMYRIVGAVRRLNKSEVTNIELYGCFLSGANLIRADLSNADIAFADLSESNLLGANLTGADLSYVNLSGADLSGANLSGANLKNANLSRATFIKTNLQDADLQDAKIGGSDLTDANLTNATLCGANLSDSGLIGAILKGTNLKGANLLNADVEPDWLSKIEKWNVVDHVTIVNSYFIHQEYGLQKKKQPE